MPILMKFEGSDGSVTTPGYEKHILLEDVEWGFQRQRETVGSDDLNRARPTLNEVTVTMMTDIVTSALVKEGLQGKRNREVIIKWARTSKDQLATYAQLTLTDATISAYSLDTAGDRPVDTFKITYLAFELKTWEWKNNAPGSSSSIEYNATTGR